MGFVTLHTSVSEEAAAIDSSGLMRFVAGSYSASKSAGLILSTPTPSSRAMATRVALSASTFAFHTTSLSGVFVMSLFLIATGVRPPSSGVVSCAGTTPPAASPDEENGSVRCRPRYPTVTRGDMPASTDLLQSTDSTARQPSEACEQIVKQVLARHSQNSLARWTDGAKTLLQGFPKLKRSRDMSAT